VIVVMARRIMSPCLVFVACVSATTIEASTFNVTDLGSSYALQQNASGAVSSVTSGNGAQSFLFTKSPVTQIDQSFQSGDGVYTTTYTLQEGTHQAGSTEGRLSTLGASINVPTIGGFSGEWATAPGTSPISDLNSSGEVVGKSNFLVQPSGVSQTSFAAFSLPDGAGHTLPSVSSPVIVANFTDDLNNYIASNLGVYLTASLKVDDLGQIIAQGTLNGQNQYFLLTPNGAPTPAPEPSTLVVVAVGITALGVRSARRRERVRPN
jgi:hypothetical protein